MDYKTPGVFIEEIPLFPPSVAPVATAVPAFIGHTAVTQEDDGASLINQPVRLTSLLDFTELFGSGYTPPTGYTVQLDPGANFNILSTAPENGRHYYLFDVLRHYFDNGGGPCYIVTVGDYTQPVIYGTDTTGLRGGLRALEKVDEPTLLAAPDSMSLQQNGNPDFTAVGNLHKDILAQCGNLQDRFGLLDLLGGQLAPDDASTPIDQFRNQVGTENLKYAATYYPWLCSTYLRDIHFTQLNFVDNQGPPVAIPDATIDTITGDALIDGLVTTLRTRLAEEQNVFGKITAIALNRSNYSPLSDQLQILRNAVMAAGNAATVRPAFSALMSFVRQLASKINGTRWVS